MEVPLPLIQILNTVELDLKLIDLQVILRQDVMEKALMNTAVIQLKKMSNKSEMNMKNSINKKFLKLNMNYKNL